MSKFNTPTMDSAFQLLGQNGRCFYIPAYQRDFSWGTDNIERFFEDIGAGIERLLNQEEDEVVTFLGTTICFHDTHYKTIHPIVRNDVPAAVWNVVDGQQRLTLLLLVAASLHDFLRVAGKRDLGSAMLMEKRATCMANLRTILEEERVTADDVLHYPRMIRAFDDQWATTIANQRYHSPLSHFIASYGAYHRANSSANAYKHQPLPTDGEQAHKGHQKFLRTSAKVKNAVKRICTGKADNFPSVKLLMEKSAVLSGLLNIGEVPSDDGFDSENDKHAQVARAIILASYILNKIHFVTLVTLDENYAFDIFEALNTTGQVLTAFETFRPEVIRAEGIEKFERSESKKHTDAVDDYLKNLKGENEKSKTTGELLISFALAEDGATIPKDLRSQRKYLRDSYGRSGALSSRREFTHHLMHAGDVMQIWKREKGMQIPALFHADASLKREAETAQFCVDFLAAPNHHIVRALITRFYEAARLADEGQKREKTADLFSVIKALAAFYAIWRGSREGTDGIDNRHRKLMREHFSRMVLSSDSGARTPRNAELSAQTVKRLLVSLLADNGGDSERKIQSRRDWVKHATSVPIYSTKDIARFLLFVAADRSRPKDNGLLEAVRDGVCPPLIAEDAWGKDDYATIEHVIPQSEWSRLECEKEELDRLGNLTLIPHRTNSLLSNRPWREKKAIFRALSAGTDSELQDAINASHFPPEHRDSEDLRARYLPMTEAVARCEKFEKIEDFEARGKNLAELAWRRLAVEWLGFDDES